MNQESSLVEGALESGGSAGVAKPVLSIPLVSGMVFCAVVALTAAFLLGPMVLINVSSQASIAETDEEQAAPEQGEGSGGEREGRGGRGGGFDPAAVFSQRDADENGILEGEEISGRMADRLDSIDADGDGSVTEEEFMSAMRNRRGGRGRPEGGRPSAENQRPAGESPEGGENAASDAESTEATTSKEEQEPTASLEDQSTKSGSVEEAATGS